MNCLISNMWAKAVTNTTDGASVFTLRKNQADTSITFSIGAGSTGEFEDTTHMVRLVPSDEINYKATDGSSSGALNVGGMSSLVKVSSIKTINGLPLESVKSVNGLAIASVKSINGLA